MTLSDGSYLIAGKQVTGFTNGEEQNLGCYPWLRRANRREIEIEAGEMPGASPASRLREILVFVRKPAAFDEQESLAQLLQLEMSWSTPSGSRSTNGSSRIRNSGSLTSAMTNARRCFMLNEKPAGLRSRYGQSPTSSSTGRIGRRERWVGRLQCEPNTFMNHRITRRGGPQVFESRQFGRFQ